MKNRICINLKRVMIAAPKSGSGKTTVACALLQALKNNGWQVFACKCGPDYIDPMFHERVTGVPAGNLDTFFTKEAKTRELFLDSAGKKDFAVLEGVMGLYDGLGGVREEGSSYHLAKVTKTPIVLVVDAKGMGRSVMPLIAGFLDYDKEHLIRGVILNRISKEYYEIIRPLIEKELKIRAVGFLPEKKVLHMESRYLGLIMPDEIRGMKERLQEASEIFSETVSLEHIIKIAESAEELKEDKTAAGKKMAAAGSHPVIAVARDEAFCFYYEDNIRLLKEYGAQITYFSPIRDKMLPRGCHALLFGGGYPELYAEKLSENSGMRAEVKRAAENRMPIVAECGGFMYLHAAMTDKEGICHDMAGVIPAVCFYTGKLVRFGYVELLEKQSNFLPEGERIKGHEFHYFDSTDNGTDAAAVKPATGKEYSCVKEGQTYWMGFPHLYYPSNPAFAKSFVEKAERYRRKGMVEK